MTFNPLVFIVVIQRFSSSCERSNPAFRALRACKFLFFIFPHASVFLPVSFHVKLVVPGCYPSCADSLFFLLSDTDHRQRGRAGGCAYRPGRRRFPSPRGTSGGIIS